MNEQKKVWTCRLVEMWCSQTLCNWDRSRGTKEQQDSGNEVLGENEGALNLLYVIDHQRGLPREPGCRSVGHISAWGRISILTLYRQGGPDTSGSGRSSTLACLSWLSRGARPLAVQSMSPSWQPSPVPATPPASGGDRFRKIKTSQRSCWKEELLSKSALTLEREDLIFQIM